MLTPNVSLTSRIILPGGSSAADTATSLIEAALAGIPGARIISSRTKSLEYLVDKLEDIADPRDLWLFDRFELVTLGDLGRLVFDFKTRREHDRPPEYLRLRKALIDLMNLYAPDEDSLIYRRHGDTVTIADKPFKCLIQAELRYVRLVANQTARELRRIEDLGPRGISAIRAMLKHEGLALRGEQLSD